MNIIVAADQNWAIGYKGNLLVSIPADHKMFRSETIGKVIVYGRKTLETFPLGQLLDRRTNIILSAKKDYQVKGAQTAHSVEELLDLLKPYDTNDVYIIGGASVYEEMLPYCDTCHVTRIDRVFQADRYFPDLDKDPAFEITAESEEQTYFDMTYHFVRYTRVKG